MKNVKVNEPVEFKWKEIKNKWIDIVNKRIEEGKWKNT
jgi:hypothetical protein